MERRLINMEIEGGIRSNSMIFNENYSIINIINRLHFFFSFAHIFFYFILLLYRFYCYFALKFETEDLWEAYINFDASLWVYFTSLLSILENIGFLMYSSSKSKFFYSSESASCRDFFIRRLDYFYSK